MNILSSPWLSLCFCAIALAPASMDAQRVKDDLSTSSGQFSNYRIDDSTRFMYGAFTATSQSGQTQISAHRLRIGTDPIRSSNSFGNDFMHGKVFTDAVDVYTNFLFLPDVVRLSAEKLTYSKDSLTIQLQGHAVVQGDDVKISSHNITVILSKWNSLGR